MDLQEKLRQKYALLFPHLTPRQRQMVAAADARQLGRGKTEIVSVSAGLSRQALYRGLRDLNDPPLPAGRERRPGSGRKKRIDEDRALLHALEALLQSNHAAETTPLRWCLQSTRQLAGDLGRAGFSVSHELVAQLLRELGYRHTPRGPSVPDAQAQLEYVRRQALAALAAGTPVLVVSGQKKVEDAGTPTVDAEGASVGPTAWRRLAPERADAAILVEALRRWWLSQEREGVSRCLLCVDCFQGKGERSAWLLELGGWLKETGLAVTVCHLPVAAIRWCPIVGEVSTRTVTRQPGAPSSLYQAQVSVVGAPAGHCADSESHATSASAGERTIVAGVEMERHLFHGLWNYDVKSLP
jgi:hypothetical protein